MKYLLTLLAFIASCSSCVPPQHPSISKLDDATVALIDTTDEHIYCTAEFIQPDVLITALHCVEDNLDDRLAYIKHQDIIASETLGSIHFAKVIKTDDDNGKIEIVFESGPLKLMIIPTNDLVKIEFEDSEWDVKLVSMFGDNEICYKLEQLYPPDFDPRNFIVGGRH